MSETSSIKPAVGTNQEIEFIQKEIEVYTKKIEHEKINLRLAKERLEKQLSYYLQLQGMPVPFKSKEQKEKEKKERKEKKKQRKPLYESKPGLSKSDLIKSNPNLLMRELNKNETELDKLTNEINQLMLENKDLKKQIQDMRKEKLSATTMLESLKNQIENVKTRIADTEAANKEAQNRIKFQELEKVNEEGMEGKKEFETYRDNLEDKYHEIIEENIRREREHKKEIFKKRVMLSSIAKSVMPGNEEGEKTQENLENLTQEQQTKLLEDEDISDRTPILDVLIEKWKYYNKYKKQMLERYVKNAISIRDAFDKMMKYLGVEDFQDLPLVLEKMEDQMSEIEIFISQLTNEVDYLDEQKKLAEYKIQALTFKIKNNSNEKSNFQESKQSNIQRLKAHIAELKEDIEHKRQFFAKLQPETDKFLSDLEQTYLSHFIPEKVTINKEITYNESNVVEVIANVQDYQKLVEEFDKSSQQNYDKKTDILVNKDIEKLRQEMKAKLEQFRKDNYIGKEFYSTVKSEGKMNSSFDDTIRKMADEIVRNVNLQTGTNTSMIKKKKY